LNRRKSQLLCEQFLECHSLEDWKIADFKSLSLNNDQAERLRIALIHDAKNYYYNGIVSFCEAINGIRRSLFSWSTIKLYYSIYYLLRSYLYINEIALIRQKSIYVLKAQNDESPSKKSNRKYNTDHSATIYYHIDLHKNKDILLSNKIGDLYVYEWMLNRREDINYRMDRFQEPKCPYFWEALFDRDVCKNDSSIIETLIKDDFLLTFQDEFACLAIPIKTIDFVNQEYKNKEHVNFLSSFQINTISELCQDTKLTNWVLGKTYS